MGRGSLNLGGGAVALEEDPDRQEGLIVDKGLDACELSLVDR